MSNTPNINVNIHRNSIIDISNKDISNEKNIENTSLTTMIGEFNTNIVDAQNYIPKCFCDDGNQLAKISSDKNSSYICATNTCKFIRYMISANRRCSAPSIDDTTMMALRSPKSNSNVGNNGNISNNNNSRLAHRRSKSKMIDVINVVKNIDNDESDNL